MRRPARCSPFGGSSSERRQRGLRFFYLLFPGLPRRVGARGLGTCLPPAAVLGAKLNKGALASSSKGLCASPRGAGIRWGRREVSAGSHREWVSLLVWLWGGLDQAASKSANHPMQPLHCSSRRDGLRRALCNGLHAGKRSGCRCHMAKNISPVLAAFRKANAA